MSNINRIKGKLDNNPSFSKIIEKRTRRNVDLRKVPHYDK